MRPKDQIIILTLLLILSSHFSYGQQKKLSQAKQFTIIQIDSICNNIDNDKKLIEGINEGVIQKKKKTIGGFSTYDLKDKMNNGTLFRIRHQFSIDLYYKYTFYYFEESVIKASLDIEDWNSEEKMKTIYSTTYYFYNNEVFKIIDENKKYSNSADILSKGLDHQLDFYKNNEELNKIMNNNK